MALHFDDVAFLRSKTTNRKLPDPPIVPDWMRSALEKGASDVHWIPEAATTVCALRIQSKWQEIRRYPKGESDRLLQQLKSLAGLPIEQPSYPLEGNLRLPSLYARISIIPSHFGEVLTVRIFPEKDPFPNLSDLGLSQAAANLLIQRLEIPGGISLVAGPTGSGKSTTALTLMKTLRKNFPRMFTLEDPVERELEGIHQISLPEQEDEAPSLLRALLRQSPDLIFIGEIRTPEILSLAASAALTGHRILSTLHAENIQGIHQRLEDLGLSFNRQEAILRLVIVQHWEQLAEKEGVRFDIHDLTIQD